MAEFLSDPEGQKTKDHVPDVHCDTALSQNQYFTSLSGVNAVH